MKKQYYMQAANSIKEMAIVSNKRQTNIEKESQALFFWILKHFQNNIKWTDYWKRNEYIYYLEIQNHRIGNSELVNDELQYSTDFYRRLFVKKKEFCKVIQRVVSIFNGIKGYKAEYFDFADFGDPIIRITLNVKNVEEE